jgi:hypothetical protein
MPDLAEGDRRGAVHGDSPGGDPAGMGRAGHLSAPLGRRDYRARYCARGMQHGRRLETIPHSASPADSYSLAFWPAPPAPDQVLSRPAKSPRTGTQPPAGSTKNRSGSHRHLFPHDSSRVPQTSALGTGQVRQSGHRAARGPPAGACRLTCHALRPHRDLRPLTAPFSKVLPSSRIRTAAYRA